MKQALSATGKRIVIIIGIITCVITILFISKSVGVFGMSADNIEKDARKSQKIDSTWEVAKATNDNLGAMIFYNDTLDEHTYSVYVKRDDFMLGYYFYNGGSNSAILDSIYEFTYGNKGSAIFSMNKDNVNRIEIDNGINLNKIDIDPTKPFVVVLPINCGTVIIYDIYDNVVPIRITETKV